MSIKILATEEEMKNISKNLPALRRVILCEHCTIKKAIHYKGGMIWRCPHRTGDVKMEGFCEYGRRTE